MATGHTVIAREEVPVRRSVYEGGTVSFPNEIVRVDGLRHSPTGWTNIELVPTT